MPQTLVSTTIPRMELVISGGRIHASFPVVPFFTEGLRFLANSILGSTPAKFVGEWKNGIILYSDYLKDPKNPTKASIYVTLPSVIRFIKSAVAEQKQTAQQGGRPVVSAYARRLTTIMIHAKTDESNFSSMQPQQFFTDLQLRENLLLEGLLCMIWDGSRYIGPYRLIKWTSELATTNARIEDMLFEEWIDTTSSEPSSAGVLEGTDMTELNIFANIGFGSLFGLSINKANIKKLVDKAFQFSGK